MIAIPSQIADVTHNMQFIVPKVGYGNGCICICTMFNNILQISVILDGATLMGIATLQVKSAQTGPQHWLNAGKKTQFLLMSTIMRKTFTYSISTTVKNPGWD